MKRKKLEKLLHEACDILSESDNTLELYNELLDVKVSVKLSEREKMAFIIALASTSAAFGGEVTEKQFSPDTFVKTMVTTYAIMRKDLEDDC